MRHKQTLKKHSKIYALERLKEIHNYDYSTFVANYYRAKDYIVWEYSKEKNLIDYAFNLVLKKEKDIIFIQCRSNSNELSLDNLVEFEEAVAEFLEGYTFFKNYDLLYFYVSSEENVSKEVLEYITQSSYMGYQVLKEFDS